MLPDTNITLHQADKSAYKSGLYQIDKAQVLNEIS